MEERDNNKKTTANGTEEWSPSIGFEGGLALIVFWLLGAIVFAQFFGRYLLSSPLAWTEEIARYLLICVGFMGGMIVMQKQSHIAIEVAHRYVSEGTSRWLRRIVDLVSLALLVTLTITAGLILPLIKVHKMAALPVSLAVVYAVVFMALVVMSAHALMTLIRRWRSD